MADVLVSLNVGASDSVEQMLGAIVNVYSDDGTTLTTTIYADDAGSKGDAITQVAGTTGITVDRFGIIRFWIAQDTVFYLKSTHDVWGVATKHVSLPS